MGCCTAFAKIVIVIISAIFLLASALLLAFGITAKASPSSITTIFSYIIDDQSKQYITNAGVDLTSIVVSNAVFMIIVGAVGVVIACIGVFGACCNVKWLLAVYGILMILLLLGEIALIIFAAVYTETFANVAEKSMYETLKTGFRNDVFFNTTSVILPTGAVDLAWATLQLKEKCCGAFNWTDYQNFTWNNNATGIPLIVPVSCCAQNSTASFPPTYASFVDPAGCALGHPSAINQQNCYDAVKTEVETFIKQYKGIAIGIAAGIGGLEVILIIFAFVLCARHNKSDKYA